MARITLTQENVDDLKALNFHTTVLGRDDKFRFRVGDKLSLLGKRDFFIEEYSAICAGYYVWQIGSFSYSWSILPMDTTMGRYCSLATNITAMGVNHPQDRISTSLFSYDKNFSIFKYSTQNLMDEEFQTLPNRTIESSRINIENDVWIGEGVVLKRGITIGTGAVIAQKAVVTKDVPPYAVVAGIPARVVKYRFDDKTIKRLLTAQWWQYSYTDFNGISLDLEVNYYLDEIEKRIESGKIKPYEPKKLFFKDILDKGESV